MAISLSNISIKTRLYLLAGGLIFFLVVSATFSIAKMEHIGTEIADITEQDIPLTRVITEITITQLEQSINLERALRHGQMMQSDPVAVPKFEKAVIVFNEYSKTLHKEISHGKDIAISAQKNAHSELALKEFKHVDTLLDTITDHHLSYEKHVTEIFDELINNNMQRAQKLTEDVIHEEEKIDDELKDLLFEIEDFTLQASASAEQYERDAVRFLIILTAFTICFGSVIAFFIIRNLNKGISIAVSTAKTISSGDLSQDIEIRGNDEIGQLLESLRSMKSILNDIMSEISSSAIRIAATSEELSAVSELSNDSLLVQKTEIENAASAMHEMSVTVQEVASNATSTSSEAQATNDSTSHGQQIVQQTVTSMNEMSRGVTNAVDVLHNLRTQSEDISSVLDVIKSIAEQTNLLALNAAIEAARAGEQGRGFAVVADEVRTLASRTQDSTSVIEEMIEKLQSGANDAVNVMETERDNASESVTLAGQAGDALQKITTAVSSIYDMNNAIASAAEEQAVAANEINSNINSINSLAEQNVVSANETTASSIELAQLASELEAMLTRFTLSHSKQAQPTAEYS